MFTQTWRWYGPNDRITLNQIRQTGATGIVTALHHIPNGEVWSKEEILKRKATIENAGLTWDVVESVPVHEDIKRQRPGFEQLIENYKESVKNLGECGIKTICYNFMPVLDWSRTDLEFEFEDGSLALNFNMVTFACFDMFILKRPGSESDYDEDIKSRAKELFGKLSDEQKQIIIDTIIKGLPGAEESYTLEDFQGILDTYKDIDSEKLKDHLNHFLREVIPVAEQNGVYMAIHPDDPPRDLLGLPRVVSTLKDAKELISVIDSPSNGVTLCTGSFGAGHFNDLVEMTKELAHRVNFAHFRNVTRDAEGNFMEHYFFEGDVDMYGVVKALVLEDIKRNDSDAGNKNIPVRPDHGNQMLDDLGKDNNPGYSLYGRMKGLAEIRGLEIGIRKSL